MESLKLSGNGLVGRFPDMASMVRVKLLPLAAGVAERERDGREGAR